MTAITLVCNKFQQQHYTQNYLEIHFFLLVSRNLHGLYANCIYAESLWVPWMFCVPPPISRGHSERAEEGAVTLACQNARSSLSRSALHWSSNGCTWLWSELCPPGSGTSLRWHKWGYVEMWCHLLSAGFRRRATRATTRDAVIYRAPREDGLKSSRNGGYGVRN